MILEVAGMKSPMVVFALYCLLASVAVAQDGFQDELLGHLAGDWIMTGTIAGDEITHDLSAEWVLGHFYLVFHEVSRERTETGELAYEAIVTIGWDEPSGQYVCQWLDSTGGSGLKGPLGYAKRNGDDLPFVFDDGTGGVILNTFSYHRDSDTWDWAIDITSGEERREFARVTLKRAE